MEITAYGKDSEHQYNLVGTCNDEGIYLKLTGVDRLVFCGEDDVAEVPCALESFSAEVLATFEHALSIAWREQYDADYRWKASERRDNDTYCL